MTLREYQKQCVDAVQFDWQTHKDVLGVLATGGGKTQIFCEVIDRECTGSTRRALVLVHRKELVEQARARLLDFWPHWQGLGRTGVVMADQDDCGAQAVFATVQTLASPARLGRLLSHGKIDVLITDEAHHAAAQTYRDIYEILRTDNPDLRHLGVTATPIRADGAGLVTVFEKTSFTYDIKWMVQHGYLVPPRWLAIQTGISLAGVSSRRGADGERDYSAKQLANVYETSNCFELVVQTHQKYAAERQAVAFLTTVEGAHGLAETFRAANIEAQAADASTSKYERRRIMDDFRAGKVRVLCNVGLYTEGLDVPEVSCIHQVRPTQSDGLYIQMIGRALRLYPDKADALILDYAPKEARQIVMLGDVLGANVRKESYIAEEDDSEEGEVIGGFTFDQTGFHWLEGNPAEIVSRQLDYLELSQFNWHRSNDGWLTIGLGRDSKDTDRTLAIGPADKDTGLMTLFGIGRKFGQQWVAKVIMQGDFDTLSAKAEEFSAKYANVTLSGKARRWHNEPASPEQQRFARKLRIKVNGQSKGELAQQITHALALQAINQSNVLTLPGGVRVGEAVSA